MRRAVPSLLVSLLLVACSPKEDYGPTKRALVNAHTARTGVIYLAMRYEEILEPASSGPGSTARSWQDLSGFHETAEGLAARRLLSEYSKPISVDPSSRRRAEIEEVSLATAALVNLALEPRGTWESFTDELKRARSRLDRAIAALETGTKGFVLIEARTETNKATSAYAGAITRAKAADAKKGEGAVTIP